MGGMALRKVITIIIIISLFPLPALGFSWADGKPTQRSTWAETKSKILATREYDELFFAAGLGAVWLLTKTKSGKAFYKANLKGDFKTMSKVAKQGRRIKLK
jgi:hypothetical protein